MLLGAFLVFLDIFREKEGSLIQAAKIPGVAVIGNIFMCILPAVLSKPLKKPIHVVTMQRLFAIKNC